MIRIMPTFTMKIYRAKTSDGNLPADLAEKGGIDRDAGLRILNATRRDLCEHLYREHTRVPDVVRL